MKGKINYFIHTYFWRANWTSWTNPLWPNGLMVSPVQFGYWTNWTKEKNYFYFISIKN